MSETTTPEDEVGEGCGRPVGREVLDRSARGATGVLRVERADRSLSVHIKGGRVTRVREVGQESLTVYLVRKGMMSAAGVRAALAEVEQQEVTLGQALESLGLMDRSVLACERAARTAEALVDVIAAGGAATFEESEPAEGESVDTVAAAIEGLLRSREVEAWLDEKPDLSLEARGTELAERLAPYLTEVLGVDPAPLPGELAHELSSRLGERGEALLGALVVGGVLVLGTPRAEPPGELEARASTLGDMREATRLLLEASRLFEEQGDPGSARRAALSALRRSPTDAGALDRVEALCVEAGEVATLELVFELVAAAMPGPFGRRSTLYRAGKVFETALGDTKRAHECYRRSFGNVPESGAVLEALERTSAVLGVTAPVAEAYAAVAMATSRPELRESWLKRAAGVAMNEGGEASALDLLLRVNEGEPSIEAERLIFELDPDRFGGEPPQEGEALGTPPEDGHAEGASFDADLGFDVAEEPSDDEPELDLEGPDDREAEADAPAQRGDAERPEASSLDELGALLDAVDEGARSGGPGQALDTPPEGGRGDGGAAEWAPAAVGPLDAEIRDHRATLARDPGDIPTLRALRAALEATGDERGERAVCALLTVVDGGPETPPLEPREQLTRAALEGLAGGLDDPQLRALAQLWRAAPQLFRKELADMGIVRALPQASASRSPATEAFQVAQRVLDTESARLLLVPAGPSTRVVVTSPPAVLVGPGGREETAELRFRICRAVAMTRAELLLACALPTSELWTTLRAAQAAFGRSPARGSLDFRAASMAQDLWTALPAEAQEELKAILASSPGAEADGVRSRAMAAANRLGLVVTGDVGAALRVAAGDDPFLAGTDPVTEEGFARAARRSEQVAALVRLALDPAYAELTWKAVSTEP